MTRMSYEETQRQNNRQKRQDHFVCAVALVGVALGSVGLFHERGVDLLGDHDHPVSPQAAIKKNTEEYKRRFRIANSASKFAMQYAQVTAIASDASTPGVRFLGVHNDMADLRYVSYFNNACLSGKAYDIGPVSLLPSIMNKQPVAAVSSNEDHTRITVQPLSGERLQLKVDMDEALLKPADKEAEQILETYGCSSGMQSNEIVRIVSPKEHEWISGPTSPPVSDSQREYYDGRPLTSLFYYVK